MRYLLIAILFGFWACGPASKEEQRARLEQQLAQKQQELLELQQRLHTLDPDTTQSAGAFVSIYQVKTRPFVHEIEIRGSVRSDKNVLISSESQGRVMRVLVEEGQQVPKGALLVQIDDRVLQNNLAEIDNKLGLAKLNYERQQNLWKQDIGTEFQFLRAENDYKALQRQRETIVSQLSYTRIRAPFGGRCEEITAKLGEIIAPGTPLLRLFNPNALHVEGEVPDNYAAKLKVNNPVRMRVVSTGEMLRSRLSYVGQVVNTENRTVLVRVPLPSDVRLLANQVITLFIEDYRQDSAVVIPMSTVQEDAQGDYVFKMSPQGAHYVVNKAHITVGQRYQEDGEVLKGLNVGEQIVNEGARRIQAGMLVQVAEKTLGETDE